MEILVLLLSQRILIKDVGIHSIENFLSKTPREEFHGCWILLCLIVPRSFEQSSEHSLQVLIQVEAGDLVRL